MAPVPGGTAWPEATSKGLVRAARATRGRRGLRFPLQLSPRRRMSLLLVETALRTPLREGGGRFDSCRSRSSPRLLLVREPSGSSRAVPLSHTRPSGWTGAGSSSSVRPGRAHRTGEAGAGLPPAPGGTASPEVSLRGRVRATPASRGKQGLTRRLVMLLPRHRRGLLLLKTALHAPLVEGDARLVSCRW